MTMTTWAENEIALACRRENPDWDGESFDYGCSCYQSALKAYKSLMEDGHSGFSFSMTRDILERLMHGLPLSPITEEDFKDAENTACDYDLEKLGIVSQKQCPRMSRLFQTIRKDGSVKYDDVNRVVCYDNGDNDCGCHCGFASNLIDEMYPITLPYCPPNGRYEVYRETFASDGVSDGYDMLAVLYVITPNGERVEVNRYWRETENGEMEEIGPCLYDAIKLESKKKRGTKNG